ncbi:cytochrome P450 [Actinoalloteichus sp. GBA129-24]|nr:cytochrome P450 [Actinoalloteichus sp. GBA129-24]
MFPRYKEVRHLLRDPYFLCAPTAAGMLAAVGPRTRQVLGSVASWVLYADPPLHSRLRGLLAKVFAPRRIVALQAAIASHADELVAGFIARGGGDAVTELAQPLPVSTISALLSVPEADQSKVRAWSDDVVLITEPKLTVAQEHQAATGWSRLSEYFDDLMGQRRVRPGADIVSGLVHADNGDRLTDEEIIANCIALLVGGHETTSSLLSSLLLAAASHAEHRDAVVGSETHAAQFVEEVLRLYGPSKITARVPREDTDVLGVPVAAGQRLILLQASANRDPEIFDAPEEFRPERRPNPHLGFGYGSHACFGAMLARMQAVALLRAFMHESHKLTIDTASVVWKPSQVLRTAARLPVSVVPTPRGAR